MNDELLRESGIEIVRTLRRAGHSAYFVGGCVRDRLLGLPLKDIDIATDARPSEVEKLYPGARFVGASFGVSLVKRNGFSFEIATFRRDGVYINHRSPETVDFGTLEDDVQRRDFTVNAMYEDPLGDVIVDPAGGRDDLEKKLLRCVGDAEARFREDALRLLRAVRFATRLGFAIEPSTLGAIVDLAPTIQYISPERHRDELTAILMGPAPGAAIRLLDETGLLHWLLPEIESMKGVEQGKEHHPEGDVFVHTCLVLDKLEPRTPLNCWAALLHDVGKPSTFEHRDGKLTFYQHEHVGADMARIILTRLRFSGDFIESVCEVVRRHMSFMNVAGMRPATLRRFISAPTIEADLAVHRADCLGSSGRLEHYVYTQGRIEEFANAAEPAMPAPLLTGRDLLNLGFPPGPLVGEILRALRDKQLDGELADRDEALAWVTDVYTDKRAAE